MTMQLELFLSCAAEKSTISAACDLYKDNVNWVVAQKNPVIFGNIDETVPLQMLFWNC